MASFKETVLTLEPQEKKYAILITWVSSPHMIIAEISWNAVVSSLEVGVLSPILLTTATCLAISTPCLIRPVSCQKMIKVKKTSKKIALSTKSDRSSLPLSTTPKPANLLHYPPTTATLSASHLWFDINILSLSLKPTIIWLIVGPTYLPRHLKMSGKTVQVVPIQARE